MLFASSVSPMLLPRASGHLQSPAAATRRYHLKSRILARRPKNVPTCDRILQECARGVPEGPRSWSMSQISRQTAKGRVNTQSAGYRLAREEAEWPIRTRCQLAAQRVERGN